MNGTGSRANATIHVASRVTEEVFSFLGPATATLAERGVGQIVILLDDPRTHTCLARFHADVELRRVPLSRNPLADLLHLRRVLKRELTQSHEPVAVHLHGLIPSALGASVVRSLGREVPVFFSPHGSRLLASPHWAGKLLVWFGRVRGGGEGQRAIASVGADESRLRQVSDVPVDLVESPVSARFFELARSESPAPQIVAGGHVMGGTQAIDMLIRLAVVLGDGNGPPEFVWVGNATDDQRARLRAVKGRWIASDDEAARAHILAGAWVYLAPAGGRGVPLGLAEAMASGVPCVVADTPFHSDAVADGITGFVYRREEEALLQVARLLDDRELRARIGGAARAEAQRRFGDREFQRRLLKAYLHSDLAVDGGGEVEAAPDRAGPQAAAYSQDARKLGSTAD